jgi:hypothetical protein
MGSAAVSAAEVLKAARAAGIRVGIDGDDLSCGGGDHGHDPLLPFGIEPTGHAWLHSRCWPAARYAGRKAEAVAALAAMGIATPADFPNDFGKNGGG